MINVTLELPLDGSSPNLKEIVESLSVEDKKEIAHEVIKEWLMNDFPMEKKHKEDQVVKNLRSKSGYGGYKNSDKTDEEIKGTYEFKKAMKDFKSTREILIEDTLKEMKGEIREYVLDQIKGHEQTEIIQKAISEAVKEDFPELIMRLFASHVMEDFSNKMMNVNRFDIFEDNVRNSLDNIYNKLNI